MHNYMYSAGHTLELPGVKFHWLENEDRIALETKTVFKSLTEENVEDLAEFCISYQNRSQRKNEQDLLRLRLESEINFYQQQISDVEYKKGFLNLWKMNLEEKRKELGALGAR